MMDKFTCYTLDKYVGVHEIIKWIFFIENGFNFSSLVHAINLRNTTFDMDTRTDGIVSFKFTKQFGKTRPADHLLNYKNMLRASNDKNDKETLKVFEKLDEYEADGVDIDELSAWFDKFFSEWYFSITEEARKNQWTLLDLSTRIPIPLRYFPSGTGKDNGYFVLVDNVIKWLQGINMKSLADGLGRLVENTPGIKKESSDDNQKLIEDKSQIIHLGRIAKKPRRREMSKIGGRKLVEVVKSESKKRTLDSAWGWLCSQARCHVNVGNFALEGVDKDGETVLFHNEKNGSIKKTTFARYWNN